MLLNLFYDSEVGWKYSQYHYDDAARTNYAKDPMQNTMTASYDRWGRQNEVVDPYGNLYRTDYYLYDKSAHQYFIEAQDVSSFRSYSGDLTMRKNYTVQYEDQWGNVISLDKSTYRRSQLGEFEGTIYRETYQYNNVGQSRLRRFSIQCPTICSEI
ncbi:hypothetical protein [Paenibacillus eucommiae]|uniref:Uncharacterized protein n=1 Tax=Paenibacillus eucommiae TaxID=1355755 RepID=A0ABS4ING2_9BACL|nr:hypothetical protein [Paenibacillus eucommiae]MBP1988705.1 hypothetical protein [Paenibacillus eucommiae]